MSDLPFKGVWIPAKVFSNTNISTNAKFLWSIVYILSNKRGRENPAHSTNLMGC